MRSTAITIGVLFWISNLATLVGSVIAGTIPNAADALTVLEERPPCACETAGTTS